MGMKVSALGLVLAAGLLLTACASRPPRLLWASEFGGTGVDDCDDIAVHESQSLLLACHSDSHDFPSAERQRPPANRDMDAYIVKVDQRAVKVLWAVRLGGSKYDGAFRIQLDSAGGAWVAGYTESLDFPTTANAVQKQFAGGQGDGFLARVSAEGQLTYSTYLGGTGSDQATDLVSDRRTSKVYAIGMTSSSDLVQARNSYNGKEDAFLASFDPTRSESLQVRYPGGAEDEKPTALALRPDGQLVVAGYTFSKEFPVQAAFQAELRGKTNAFLARFSTGSGELLSSTFFGGNGEDSAWGMALSQTGDIHLLGISNSSDFPTTPGAFQPKVRGGFDIFVASFDPAVQRLRYSSCFGGSGNDIAGVDGKNVTVDSQGRVWFVGMTDSQDLPLRHAHQPSFGGGDGDGVIAALSPTGASLAYGSYHGGTGRDLLEGLFLTDGALYATGLSFGGVLSRRPQLPHGSAANAILFRLQQ